MSVTECFRQITLEKQQQQQQQQSKTRDNLLISQQLEALFKILEHNYHESQHLIFSFWGEINQAISIED